MSEEKFEGPEDLNQPPAFFPYADDDSGHTSDFEPGDPVRVQVEAVFVTQTERSVQRYVLLSDGDRKLPILIGPFEASAITFSIENHQPDRPLTHDLLKTVLDNLGAEVQKILIDDLWQDTYYAKIFLKTRTKELVLDSRPSDAIALAVRAQAPIYVVEGILNQSPH